MLYIFWIKLIDFCPILRLDILELCEIQRKGIFFVVLDIFLSARKILSLITQLFCFTHKHNTLQSVRMRTCIH